MFGKTIIIPATEDTPAAYKRLLDALNSVELRDFLRVKISERACKVPEVIASKGSGSTIASMLAGEINAFKYLLEDAPVQVEKVVTAREAVKFDTSVTGRFASRINENVSD